MCVLTRAPISSATRIFIHAQNKAQSLLRLVWLFCFSDYYRVTSVTITITDTLTRQCLMSRILVSNESGAEARKERRRMLCAPVVSHTHTIPTLNPRGPEMASRETWFSRLAVKNRIQKELVLEEFSSLISGYRIFMNEVPFSQRKSSRVPEVQKLKFHGFFCFVFNS